MVKLRLMRMGKKKQPFYRVVAADSRSPRNGRFIEIVGTYDPRQEPSSIAIDNSKAVSWLRKGAQPTERVEKLLRISGAWDEFKGLAPGTSVPTPPPAAPPRSQPAATPTPTPSPAVAVTPPPEPSQEPTSADAAPGGDEEAGGETGEVAAGAGSSDEGSGAG